MAELYDSAILERLISGGLMLVLGIEVYITSEAINQYFEASYVFIRGGCGIEVIDDVDPYRGRLAAIIRLDGLD